MAKSKVSKKGESNQDKFETGETFEAFLDEMSKMKYVDFRKEATQLFGTIHDAMIESIGWYGEDRDGYLDIIAKKFKLMDEELRNVIITIDKRIKRLESYATGGKV